MNFIVLLDTRPLSVLISFSISRQGSVSPFDFRTQPFSCSLQMVFGIALNEVQPPRELDGCSLIRPSVKVLVLLGHVDREEEETKARPRSIGKKPKENSSILRQFFKQK